MSNERNSKEEDEFDALDDLDLDDEDDGRLLKWVYITCFMGAVAGFIALAWYAYQSGMEPTSESEVPVVEADAGNIKEKPTDPGGWQFDHQDKSVYNQLATGGAEDDRPVAERVMPAPEEPIERPNVEEILAAKNPATTTDNEDAAPVPEPAPAVGNQAVTDEVAKPGEKQAPVEEVKPAEEKVTVVPSTKEEHKTMEVIEPKVAPKEKAPVTAPKAAAKVATAAPKSGSYIAQLGAFRSEAEADAAWKKVEKAHGSAFPTHNHNIQRADLGAKGIFYRLQLGPIGNEADAKKICAYLQQNKQGCFAVKVK